MTYDTLFRRWRLHLLIVAANRLGVLNHVALTVRAADAAGLSVDGRGAQHRSTAGAAGFGRAHQRRRVAPAAAGPFGDDVPLPGRPSPYSSACRHRGGLRPAAAWLALLLPLAPLSLLTAPPAPSTSVPPMPPLPTGSSSPTALWPVSCSRATRRAPCWPRPTTPCSRSSPPSYRVRRQYWGNRVRLHFLCNAQSGLCSEDCHYCSQSSVSTAEIEKYPVLARDRSSRRPGARRRSRPARSAWSSPGARPASACSARCSTPSARSDRATT